MRRVALGALLVSFGLAGFLTASVVAGTRPLLSLTDSTATTSTDATAPADTSTAPTQTPTASGQTTLQVSPPVPRPKPKPKRAPRPLMLAPRVTVGGVRVGGLTRQAAYHAVRLAFRSPLVLLLDDHRLSVSPERLGAVAHVKAAVARAAHALSGARVPFVVTVRGAAVRAYVAQLAHRFDRKPVDARVVLRDVEPRIVGGRSGRALRRIEAVRAIVRALTENRRRPVRLPARTLPPRVAREEIGPVVVIRRESKQLFYYRGEKLVRVFRVATGQPQYPTPLGRFSIVVKWRDPWWYPPSSPWAQGLKPVPPGPGNPLGTRWMGLSVPAVGIHGTPDAASLGYSASHGCIRMAISSAEWLFERVRVGTPVFIVDR